MSMTVANAFWLENLRGCAIDRLLALPYDRHRVSSEHRSGRGTTTSFHLGEQLSQAFHAYASANNTPPEHLALACYYSFLFKLTNGETDVCIGMNTHGRYRAELKTVLGMFVNAIPLRCRIDPYSFFARLVEDVNMTATRSLEYAYFPLQSILAQHPLALKPTFLDTSFEFRSMSTESNACSQIMLSDIPVSIIPNSTKIDTDTIVSKFDFALIVERDSNTNQMLCKIDASLDLFNVMTVNRIGQRFLLVLNQLFEANAYWNTHNIDKLTLVLPDETPLIQSIKNCNEISLSSYPCIRSAFVSQCNEQPQKIAVELDEQSLTYNELMHYSQKLAIYLLFNHAVKPGETICQCVERSLSMVS